MDRELESKGRKVVKRPLDPEVLSKVPEVTLIFWIVKVAATTLGETGGLALDPETLRHQTMHALLGSLHLADSAIHRHARE